MKQQANCRNKYHLVLKGFLIFIVSCWSATLFAQPQKFVFAYSSAGELLAPKNAAAQCPDPDGDEFPATVCNGVLVDDDGNYSLRLPNNTVSNSENILLVANEYNYIAAEDSQDSLDRFILINSKRRVDNIPSQGVNNGLDINHLSESILKAIENASNVSRGKKGSFNNELSDKIKSINAEKLNTAMGNGKTDNAPTSDNYEHDLANVNLEKLNTDDESTLDSFAALVVENSNNDDVQDVIRKNVLQALVQPNLLQEISDRVYSHILDLKSSSNEPTIVLQADKYLVYLDELSLLNTDNSINPTEFFAYTWQGVNSDKSRASFSQPDKGAYLVCVTGELNVENDSSTDCIRLTVKNTVEALARASSRRIGTLNTLRVSGSLSVGAVEYNWSGPGTFEDSNAESTFWTAPNTPGTYELTLTVNNEVTDTVEIEVFDVIPVAIAEADKYLSYIDNGSAQITLSSGSIASDGSPVESLQWSVIEQPQNSLPRLSSTSNKIIEFTTDVAGKYKIELLATKRGKTDATELMLYIRLPGAPVANAGKDIITFRNQSTKLDGSNSYASEGKSLNYLWQSAVNGVSNSTLAIADFLATELGNFSVNLDVNDGQLSDSDTVNVMVVNRLPIASDAVYANVLNEVLHGKLVGLDYDGDDISYTLITQPTNGGVTIDETSGDFTYVPGGYKGCNYRPYQKPIDNNNGGKDVPVIKLCADRFYATAGETINLTTSNSINASKFSGFHWEGGAVADPDDIRQATFTATENGTFHVCIVGNIGQSKNTSTACVDLTVSETNTNFDSNIETGYVEQFTYETIDPFGASKPGVINITIGWENTVPTVENASYTTNEDTQFSGILVASDEDAHSLTYELVGNPTLGKLTLDDASTGAFTYTPDKDKHGQDSFSFIAKDGLQNSAIGVVSITVNSSNDYPVAFYAGVLSTLEDTSVTSTLGAIDPDNDVLDFRLATLPNKGTVVINNTQTGAFTYTPNKDENGADSFFFVVHDSEYESNLAQVNIGVTPVNDPPVSENLGPVDVYINEILTQSLNAADVDNDVLIYKLKNGPQKGQVNIDPILGTFIYTPDKISLGSDSFTYTTSDGKVLSNIATVSINLLPFNNAPIADPSSIIVFEGVPYGGRLSANDVENDPLTFTVENAAKLGQIEFINSSTGEFTYTPQAFTNGNDYFTVTVSDGKKTSLSVVVNVQILSASSICKGPDSSAQDLDQDGYADFVELAFETNVNNNTSTPKVLINAGATTSCTDDDDTDGYSDISELWLQTDFLDSNSKPSLSTLPGLPRCMSPLYDNVPPALFAFNILTPSLDVSGGDATAGFVITAIDNAVGVKEAAILLRSPLGAEVTGKLEVETGQVAFYHEFTSNKFNKYAQQGDWIVAELRIKDVTGNELVLTTNDLTARSYPTVVQIINNNEDITPPQLDLFSVLTPIIDVTTGDAPASFDLSASDDNSGMARISVKLVSPSGNVFHWGERSFPENTLAVAEQIDTNLFNANSEPGIWHITEVSLEDHAKNLNIIDESTLTQYTTITTIEIIGPVIVPENPPQLVDFTITNNALRVGEYASFTVTATDDLSGVAKIELELESSVGGSIRKIAANILQPETSVSVDLNSAVFGSGVACSWRVKSLYLEDARGNHSKLTTSTLETAGYKLNVNVTPCTYGHRPSAFSTSIQTDEDTSISATFDTYDSLGHSLNYVVVTQGKKGNISVTNNDTGSFTYTPRANEYGTDSFEYKVDDGTGESNKATVTVTINPTADPTEASDFGIDVIEDNTYVGTFLATDADTEPQHLNYTIISNGTLGTATVLENDTFQYVPNPGVIGGDQFTYQAYDGNSISSIATVSVTISPEIVLTGFEIPLNRFSNVNEFVRINCNITLSKDITQISEAYLSLEGPSGQTVGFQAFVNGSSYPFVMTNNVHTPSQPLETGIWTFKNLIVKKTGNTFSKFIAGDIGPLGFSDTIEIVNNNPPVVINETYDILLNAVIDANLKATDLENDTLTYEITKGGDIGEFSLLNANTGAYKYIPNSIGTDTIRFVVSDGLSISAEGVITINTSTVVPPVADNSSFSVGVNSAYLGNLKAKSTNGNSLRYSIVSSASKGEINLIDANTGEFEYRPNDDEVGTDSFTFKVNDGDLDSNIATVSVSIVVPNRPPNAHDQALTAFENITYSGQVTGSDSDGNAITFRILQNTSSGVVQLDSITGNFTYTPFAGVTGIDRFSFLANDGELDSQIAEVSINLISATQACGNGGIYRNLDSDADGYADVWEHALGTDVNDSLSMPTGLTFIDNNIDISVLDSDLDTYTNHIEMWMESDFDDVNSVPDFVYSGCFQALSDGVKPRLAGLDIQTPTIDIAQGQQTVLTTLSLLDNASGLKRARVSLMSPSGAFLTKSVSFPQNPLLVATELSIDIPSDYAEAGTWQISGLTLYDQAGNRLNLNTQDLLAANLPTDIVVLNANADSEPPSIDSFVIATPYVYPGTVDESMSVQIGLSDNISGISSIRIDFISPTGTIVSASQTLELNPTQVVTQIDTPILSTYLEDGLWQVHSLLLVDAAGNSVQMAQSLSGLGYDSTIQVTNPTPDLIAASLESFTILSPIVYPISGDSKMSFGMTNYDNLSGVEKIEIQITGPAGQILYARGQYHQNFPTMDTVQVDTPTLSALLQEGIWVVTNVTLIDNAGNRLIMSQTELEDAYYQTSIEVRY